MKYLLQQLKVQIPDKIYVKDPESSALGKKIIKHSILLIDTYGFEQFNFKKLGTEIGSNESSIYRYFENKHKLLLYLTSWYWGWLEYQLVFNTHSITNSKDKLKRSIEILTRSIKEDSSFSHINEVLLSQIVINEYSKSYSTKKVDVENKAGYYSIYKRLIVRIKECIELCDDTYPFPMSLASTIIEGALHQHFLREHFSSLTDCSQSITPTRYFLDMLERILNIKFDG
ncbi:TetR/AcrR family transcriptional regulator [Aquimarina sp. ERC-38]|uniref:TetR/AcrR family transcriptional regulator n=1 Tax=Aquimarina sp. ERC-38 TaxID=2949996 RepID=UPI002245D511|nr:TetR/AcrR family transcriptional regulator [Aquimarina sp. ERC-38]UZO82454.1 TetR/AcrR family transcriptional regulator [Aquimarina sp. ERC-38]